MGSLLERMEIRMSETGDRAQADETAGSARRHVLIVDDHEINRRVVSLLIAPHGWTWTMAADGAEAVELCHLQAFDVILMDMQMPVMDGIAATRCIRAMCDANARTPIVALTANALDYHRRLWAEVGVEEFLTKPIDPDVLIATLHRCAAQTWAMAEPDGAQGSAA